MKAKQILIALSILVLVLAAFFLGQRTQIPHKKKVPVKKVAEPRQAKKKSATMPGGIEKPARAIKIAIVIDDFGYTMSNLPVFFDINEPLTFSILPNLRHSRDVAAENIAYRLDKEHPLLMRQLVNLCCPRRHASLPAWNRRID